MQQPLLPDLLRPILNFPQLKSYLEKNWFKILLILLFAYVLLSKDVNLQFSLNSADEIGSTEVLPVGKVEVEEGESWWSSMTNSTEMAMLSGLFSADAANEQQKNNAPEPVKSNEANNFSNLTFILSPDYAQRKNIPEEVVLEKKQKCRNYVKRFAPVAVAEMKKFGIPASITIAQALLESNVGESRLTKANKNHFGIKCFSKKCSKGHCANFTDDTHKDFFRIYANAWESYRGHSLFLQNKRYEHLLDLPLTDYVAWATGLKEAGYATDPRYPEKLIKIIETLNLDKLDQI